MTSSSEAAVLPGIVRQIGYVVTDLDDALASWLSLGIGPWYVMRSIRQSARYRGEPCEVTLSVAFSNTGDLQVELIHQDDETPSIYTEFLESGGSGFHQLAWWATDYDTALRAAQASGWPVVWSGGADGSVRYAYLEPPAGPAAVVELMELNEMMLGMSSLVRAAATDWDGCDPIRSLA